MWNKYCPSLWLSVAVPVGPLDIVAQLARSVAAAGLQQQRCSFPGGGSQVTAPDQTGAWVIAITFW